MRLPHFEAGKSAAADFLATPHASRLINHIPHCIAPDSSRPNRFACRLRRYRLSLLSIILAALGPLLLSPWQSPRGASSTLDLRSSETCSNRQTATRSFLRLSWRLRPSPIMEVTMQASVRKTWRSWRSARTTSLQVMHFKLLRLLRRASLSQGRLRQRLTSLLASTNVRPTRQFPRIARSSRCQ